MARAVSIFVGQIESTTNRSEACSEATYQRNSLGSFQLSLLCLKTRYSLASRCSLCRTLDNESSELSAVPLSLRGCNQHRLSRASRSRSHLALGSMSRSVPDMLSHAAPAVLETLPVPAASEIFAGSDLSNDTHLHEYLASQLLGADTANGAEKNQDIQQSHNSLSWPPVPFVPATYRSEALSLFGDHTAIDYEGALSPLRLCDGELPVSTFTATSESELVKGTASASSQDAAVRQETGKRRKLNKSLVPQVHIHCKLTYPVQFGRFKIFSCHRLLDGVHAHLHQKR